MDTFDTLVSLLLVTKQKYAIDSPKHPETPLQGAPEWRPSATMFHNTGR